MSIVLVGGHDRMHSSYKKVCKKNGHKVKIFTQMPARFSKGIGTPDALVIFTNTVSHKMVIAANKEAKRKKIPVFRNHNSSSVALENSIKEIEESI